MEHVTISTDDVLYKSGLKLFFHEDIPGRLKSSAFTLYAIHGENCANSTFLYSPLDTLHNLHMLKRAAEGLIEFFDEKESKKRKERAYEISENLSIEELQQILEEKKTNQVARGT